MKSSFLLTLILGALVSNVGFAQTKKTQKPVANTPAKAEEGKTATTSGSSQSFYDRLKIGYFGSYQGSSLGQWDRGASDEFGNKYPEYAHNLFNQVSFNFNFGGKMNFVVNPRFTVYTGGTGGHAQHQRAVVQVEDALIGFQGTIYSSESKAFNWWIRPAVRVPTSRGSRKNDVTLQPELLNNITFDIDKKWQLGTIAQFRMWAYNDRFSTHRYRIYVAPFVQYTINDTTKFQIYYENYSENRNHSKSQTNEEPLFQNYWETILVGVAKDITPKLNVMPLIAYHLNTTRGGVDNIDKYAPGDRPLDPIMVGAWISYQIK